MESHIAIATERYEKQRIIVTKKTQEVAQAEQVFTQMKNDLQMETIKLAAESKALDIIKEMFDDTASEDTPPVVGDQGTAVPEHNDGHDERVAPVGDSEAIAPDAG